MTVIESVTVTRFCRTKISTIQRKTNDQRENEQPQIKQNVNYVKSTRL
jgi:hypothetical protein